MTEEHVEGWLDVTCPDAEDRAEPRARVRSRFADPDWQGRRFVALDEGRQVRAASLLLVVGTGQLLLVGPRTRGKVPIESVDARLVDECVDAALRRGARSVETRPPVDRVTAPLREALERSGGLRMGDRIEYETPVEELPGESGDPLVWSGVTDLAYAAALFRDARPGARTLCPRTRTPSRRSGTTSRTPSGSPTLPAACTSGASTANLWRWSAPRWSQGPGGAPSPTWGWSPKSVAGGSATTSTGTASRCCANRAVGCTTGGRARTTARCGPASLVRGAGSGSGSRFGGGTSRPARDLTIAVSEKRRQGDRRYKGSEERYSHAGLQRRSQ